MSSPFSLITIVTIASIVSVFYLTKRSKKKIFYDGIPKQLIVDHDVGFFSNVSVKFQRIVEFVNKYHKLPLIVDGSRQFSLYKKDPTVDATFDFFKNYSFFLPRLKNMNFKQKIPYNECYQYRDYSKIYEFQKILPLFNAYFTPSDLVIKKVKEIKTKYFIEPDNCIGVYFRGTDKKTETTIPSYQVFYDKVKNVYLEKNKEENKNLKLFLQTDTAQFMDFFNKNKYDWIKDENIIIVNENSTSYTTAGIHNEKLPEENYKDIFNLFATFLLLAKCKYYICSSGNCSAIMMLYRGNGDNVYQFLNGNWLR